MRADFIENLGTDNAWNTAYRSQPIIVRYERRSRKSEISSYRIAILNFLEIDSSDI